MMSDKDPKMGLRKWQAFKTSLVYFTAFDVFNIITLIVAVKWDVLPKMAVADPWPV